jgi:hypothetical protein
MLGIHEKAEERSVRVSSLVSPVSLSERELAHIWEGQRFPPEALATRDGQRLRVVYRGRAGGGPGPDYRDAIIAAPPGVLQGDVELHVRSSDFRRHGHHRDAAYNGVALHVVLWQDEAAQTVLASGRAVPTAVLGDWAEGRAREIRAWLERPMLWQEPCRTSIGRLGTAQVGAALDRLGDERFRAKAAAFARQLSGRPPEEVLWQGLLEALGYGGDRPAFRRLAEELSWVELRALITPLPASARADEARRLLAAAFGGCYSAAIETRSVRPANRPQRRLEGAAALAARFAAGGLMELLAPLRRPAAEARRSMERALAVRGVIGPGRVREMLANAVLPVAAVLEGGRMAGAAAEVYAGLPLPARSGSVRHLHKAVGGHLEMSARRQQGMLGLLNGYCTRGGCGKCPLS